MFGHCYGLMKCQDKTVSTLEYTCHLLACAHAVKPINFGFVQMLRLLSFFRIRSGTLQVRRCDLTCEMRHVSVEALNLGIHAHRDCFVLVVVILLLKKTIVNRFLNASTFTAASAATFVWASCNNPITFDKGSTSPAEAPEPQPSTTLGRVTYGFSDTKKNHSLWFAPSLCHCAICVFFRRRLPPATCE